LYLRNRSSQIEIFNLLICATQRVQESGGLMSTPSLPPHHPHDESELAWRPLQRSTRVAILAALLAALWYQIFLLSPQYRGNLVLWVAVLFAEGLTAAQAIGIWWTILAHDNRPEPVNATVWRNRLVAGATPPSIDVFITAYGEPPALIRATVRAARSMLLPHRTWVLDDGDSDEVEHLCRRERVGYLRRGSNDHAKAGNINAALTRTSGEFIVILDADHVPVSRFLLEVLPHFVDPKVAFVQSPQHYSNKVNLVSTGSAEAQRIFYELVCPGKNHFNAAFCVGTNVMFRRAALEDVGGIHTGSNSEDIWTSIRLHRRGWKSIYVPNVLATGLAPDTLDAYLRQQLRWASGGFEVLVRGQLFRRGNGLTIDQRLQYLFTGMHYLLSLAMLTFMLLPAGYLLFGLSPIDADGWTWALHYIPFYAMTLLVTWLQSGGFRVAAIVASIGAVPVHVRALFGVLTNRKVRWTATNTAAGGRQALWVVMPHIALLVLNVMAIAVGVTVMTDPGPTWLSIGWASMIILMLGRMIGEVFVGHRTAAATPEPATPEPAAAPVAEDKVAEDAAMAEDAAHPAAAALVAAVAWPINANLSPPTPAVWDNDTTVLPALSALAPEAAAPPTLNRAAGNRGSVHTSRERQS
jgi:cellulose synthase (UDP-forming)